jgi:hypothetical protein
MEEKHKLFFAVQPNVRKLFGRTKEAAALTGETQTYWNRLRKYKFTDFEGICLLEYSLDLGGD